MKSSQDIARRKLAAGEAWNAHLENTRQYICETLNHVDCKDSKRVVVLGSGHLFDVPVDALCEHFETVVLVDLEHPSAAQKAKRRHTNIRLVTCDVTGVIKDLPKAARRGDALPAPAPPHDFLDGADLVVSLNLLSQIPIWPHTILTNFGHYDETKINAYMAELIENHLEWLKRACGAVCLISDYEREISDGPNVLKCEDILFGVQLGDCDKKWKWSIAPRPIQYSDRDVSHNVCACRFSAQRQMPQILRCTSGSTA